MKLIRLSCSTYRGLPARQLSFTDRAGTPHPLVAITGRAGCGKTTLLELLALHKEHVAPYGRAPRGEELLTPGMQRLEVSTQWELDEGELRDTGGREPRLSAISVWDRERPVAKAAPELTRVLGRYQHGGPWGKVDFVPASRWSIPQPGGTGDPVRAQKRNRLSLSGDKYAGIVRLVAEANDDDRTELERYLTAIVPELRLAFTATGAVRFSTRHGLRRYTELAPSHRMLATMAITFSLVRLRRSVVLIDSPELGLAPGRAPALLCSLRELTPTTQLIVTTQDPEVLAKAAVIHLEES